MLKVPEGASAQGLIVSIDPGSTNLGYGKIYFDVRDLEIIQTTAFTLDGSRMDTPLSDADTHGDRYTRIFALAKALENQFIADRPNLIICESPFMAKRMPMAFGALTEVVFAARIAARAYSANIPLELIDPPSAKKAVGAMGNAKKDAMLVALKAMTPILKFTPNQFGQTLEQLDEHSVDAIAIAYSLLLKLRA